MSRWQPWWQARAPRERAMLLAMAACLAAFAWWYGLFVPLRAWREAATQRHDHANAELRAVEADARALAALRGGPATPDARDAAILASARAAGVPVSRRRTTADGALAVEIDAVEARTLFAWVDALRREHGIGPQALDASEANGRLRATVTFAGATP